MKNLFLPMVAVIVFLVGCQKDELNPPLPPAPPPPVVFPPPPPQVIQTDFNKLYGGFQIDVANTVTAGPRGGYVLAGYTESKDGDVSTNFGESDAWVVSVDSGGNKLWQRSFGTVGKDHFSAIAAAPDSGFVMVGFTNFIGFRGDLYVVRIDKTGKTVWEKSFGGTADDGAYSIIAAKDGGYIVAGYTGSKDGQLSGDRDSDDVWIIKVDENGDLLWQKTYGGTRGDYANTIMPTSDGGYLFAGRSGSSNRDVPVNHGSIDVWVIKTDAAGNKLWQKTYGGSSAEIVYSIALSKDGGYLLAGDTYSNDKDVSGNHGDDDAWVIKIDAAGNLVWQKTYGGSGLEYLTCIIPAIDGGYALTGHTYSTDGDLSGTGKGDYAWVFKIDENGNKVWQKTFGGSELDFANSIMPISKGRYLVSGMTGSAFAGVTGHGNVDAWLFTVKNP